MDYYPPKEPMQIREKNSRSLRIFTFVAPRGDVLQDARVTEFNCFFSLL